MEALQQALEGLRVAEEELRVQNQELARARDAAEREGQRYQELFDLAPDAYLVTDMSGVVREANAAATRLLGLAGPLLAGKPLAVYVAQEERRRFRRKLLRLAEGDGTSEWEVRLQPRHGQALPAALTVSVARSDPRGEPVGLRWLVRDLRDPQRAEADRLREVTDAIPHIVWIAQPAGGILHYNQRFHAYTGLTLQEAQGTGWRATIHPDDLPGCLASREQALASGAPWEYEYRLKGADGAYRWFLARAVPVRDEQGTLVRWVGTGTDIQARKEAEQERAGAAARQARIAETLQRSLLLLPPTGAFPGLEVNVQYQGAEQDARAAGDFYDAFRLDEHRVALVVGDVTGKGLHAATYAAEVKFALRAILGEHPHPAAALGRLNRFLVDGTRLGRRPGESLVALALAVVDTGRGAVTCSVAGLEPPLLLRATGEAESITAGGLLLGAEAAADYEAAAFTLGPRDLFLFATDGITEARRAQGADFFGYEGLVRAAKDARGLGPIETIGTAIVGAARAFAAGALRDDVCLLLDRRW